MSLFFLLFLFFKSSKNTHKINNRETFKEIKEEEEIEITCFGNPEISIGEFTIQNNSLFFEHRTQVIDASREIISSKKKGHQLKLSQNEIEEFRREIEKIAKEVLEITEEIDPDVPLRQYGLTSNTAISLGSK